MHLFNSNMWTYADEMNLYLTWKGLKPASIVDLYIGVEEEDKTVNEKKIRETDEKFSSLLEKRCICFEKETEKFYGAALSNGKPIKEYNDVCIAYYIAKEKENLEMLLGAWTKRKSGEVNHKALGTALGFPKEAVDAFLTKRGNVLICGAYNLVEIAKAKKAGMEIPGWLAYTPYVIEELDLINGKVSESSKASGEKYRRYIRKHNPKLARKIEDNFRHMVLPEKWKLQKDGFYRLNYGEYGLRAGD